MNSSLIWGLLAYLAIIAGFAWYRKEGAFGKRIQLFKAFFPSWRFFEDIGTSPRLLLRWMPEGQSEWSAWIEAMPALQRRRFFVNAEGNLAHAYGSLLQTLIAEAAETPEAEEHLFEDSLTYRMVRAWTKQCIRRIDSENRASRYQFKVIGVASENPDAPSEDLILSPPYEVNP